MKEKVEIEKVYARKDNGVVPTLMKFQNGKLTAFTKENTQFCRLRNRNDANQVGSLLVVNGHTYQGLINDTESNELTDTYICVRNKTTNKMTVIPVDQVTLKHTMYQEIGQTQHQSLSDHKRKLTLLKTFGSRKASRFINDQEKMHMDVKIVQNELERTVNEAEMEINESEENLEYIESLDKIRPPINKLAEEVNEIYDIENLIPNNLLSRMDEEAKMIYQTQIEQIPINSEYLKKLIQNIQASPADNESLTHIKLIIYMDALLRLIKSRAKSLKKLELSEISEKVENSVRDVFSDPNSFSGSRTYFSTEKAICYFIVLCLLVNNYKVNGAILSQELNIPKSKVFKYAQIVQALPNRPTNVLSLKLPKNVPALKHGFTRSKK